VMNLFYSTGLLFHCILFLWLVTLHKVLDTSRSMCYHLPPPHLYFAGCSWLKMLVNIHVLIGLVWKSVDGVLLYILVTPRRGRNSQSLAKSY
jgi:hypothetical protein